MILWDLCFRPHILAVKNHNRIHEVGRKFYPRPHGQGCVGHRRKVSCFSYILAMGSELTTMPSTGLGLETVKHLALHGATVYIGARSEPRAKQAIAGLLSAHKAIPKARLIWLPLDLSKPTEVVEAAQLLRSKETRLDLLGEGYTIPVLPRSFAKGDICQSTMLVSQQKSSSLRQKASS